MTEQTTKSARCPRWVKIALALSLAANLLVVGLGIGMATHFKAFGGPPRASDAGGAYTTALSPKDRREIGRDLTAQFRDMRQSRTEVLGEYRAMLKILKTEPFDRAAAESILQRQSDIADQRRKAGERALLNRLEAMTPAERAALLSVLRTGLPATHPASPRLPMALAGW